MHNVNFLILISGLQSHAKYGDTKLGKRNMGLFGYHFAKV